MHSQMQVGNLLTEEMASPARLLLGFGMRVQNLHTRLVLLNLALPLSGLVKHLGKGRKVEVVLRQGAPGQGRMSIYQFEEIEYWR